MPRHARPTTVYPVSPPRELEVLSVLDITPGMRRVTLTGPALDAGLTDGVERHPFASDGFDDAFRLFFPYPGESEPVLPYIKDGKAKFPTDPRPLAKTYTVRNYDADKRELEVDFVKHGIGVATTWAYRAQQGDRIHIGGPIASEGLPQGFDWWLVVGDETALPAIGRMLEDAPEDVRAQVFVEVAETEHFQQLRELAGVEITWLSRDGAEPAAQPLLLEAVKSAQWWEGDPFAWIAGEQSIVRDLRRHLVEERGLDKSVIDFTGYWKRSEVVASAEDAAVPNQDEEAAHEKFHDQADLIPAIAIRTAADLGIGDLISRGIKTSAELASRSGSDLRSLLKLLRYLQALELLEQPSPDIYALTETGEFLANTFWIDHLRSDGVDGIRNAGIVGLTEAIRTGRPTYAAVTGRSFDEVKNTPDFEHKYLEDVAEYASYGAVPFSESAVLQGIERLTLHCDAANVVARELTARHTSMQVTIATTPLRAQWLRADLPTTITDPSQRERVDFVEQGITDAAPESDAVVLIHQLGALSDADAAAALRSVAHSAGRVLVIEHLYDLDDLDEHDGEADLSALTRDGTGLRTEAELDAVIASAGLRVAQVDTFGWGEQIRELTR